MADNIELDFDNIEIGESGLTELLDSLTHIPGEDDELIPWYCTLDMVIEGDANKEDVINEILESGFRIYKFFPGETLGEIEIVAAPDFSVEDNLEQLEVELCGEDCVLTYEEILKGGETTDELEITEIDESYLTEKSNLSQLSREDLSAKIKETSNRIQTLLKTINNVLVGNKFKCKNLGDSKTYSLKSVDVTEEGKLLIDLAGNFPRQLSEIEVYDRKLLNLLNQLNLLVSSFNAQKLALYNKIRQDAEAQRMQKEDEAARRRRERKKNKTEDDVDDIVNEYKPSANAAKWFKEHTTSVTIKLPSRSRKILLRKVPDAEEGKDYTIDDKKTSGGNDNQWGISTALHVDSLKECPEEYINLFNKDTKTLTKQYVVLSILSELGPRFWVKTESLDEENELEKRAKKHKRTDKKGAKGWFTNPNAGNVEQGIEMFNHAMGSDASGSDCGDAGASVGGASCGESLEEDVEKHDTLNPKLWNDDNTLKPEVKEKIDEIVEEFTDGLANDGIKFNVKDVKLVGSNCSYNYNDKSDLDIHIVMDTKSLECPDNLYPLLYSAYRSLFNGKMDIEFYGIPVEIYVETDDTVDLNDKKEESLNESVVHTDYTISELRSLVNNIYHKVKSIDKPEQRSVGGTYYGSRELHSKVGNMLDIIHNYTYYGGYYEGTKHYNNCYAVKVGGAYNRELYREECNELRKRFNYRVVSGYGLSDKIIVSDFNGFEYEVELIDTYGTNFSVFGFNIVRGVASDSNLTEARAQSAVKSNGIYSVKNNKWIKEPVAEDIPELDKEAFDKLFKEWEDRYLSLVGNDEVNEPEVIEADGVLSIEEYYSGKQLKEELLNEEELYGLFATEYDENGNKVDAIDLKDRAIELGSKEYLQKQKKAYEDSWNVNSQNHSYKFRIKFLGHTSY